MHEFFVNQCTSRFRRMRHPLTWWAMNGGITLFFVLSLAFYYTQHMCEQRTEYINAGELSFWLSRGGCMSTDSECRKRYSARRKR